MMRSPRWFSSSSPQQHAFLRPSNLVYIFGLSTVYMVLAMSETLVLLLGEIDLSVGAVALVGGVIAFKLVGRRAGLAVVGGHPRIASRVRRDRRPARSCLSSS